jgi:hypothetical protein
MTQTSTKASNRMQIRDLPSYAYSLLYIWAWSKRQRLRRLAYKLYSPVGYVGLVAIAIEIILEIAHAFERFRGIRHWTGIGLLAILVLLVGYRRRESLEQRRHEVFLESANLAVNALDQLSFDDPAKNKFEELRDCVNRILKILLDTFAWKGSLNANVMLPREDGTLKIEFVQASEGVKYDKDFTPKPGEGAAGLCFSNQAIIYLPNIRHRHAVELRFDDGKINQTVQTEVYVSVPTEFERYLGCILCAPVAARHKCFGVLNLDSQIIDPFAEKDYFAVVFFGAIIGLALSRYQLLTPTVQKP